MKELQDSKECAVISFQNEKRPVSLPKSIYEFMRSAQLTKQMLLLKLVELFLLGARTGADLA